MTTFDDRERAFENLFAQGQDLAFRARARRDHAIGLWAALQWGRSGEDAEACAGKVLMTSIDRDGTEAVVATLGEDLARHGLSVTDHPIRRRMDDLPAEAVARVKIR